MTRNEVEQFITRLKSASADEYNGIITALWMHDTEQREEIRLLREAIDLAMSSRAVVMGRVDAFTILSHFHAKLGSDYCKQRDEARQEIERLRGELSHWTFVRFKELEASNERSMMALQGILDIGKRDMTNPKYDGYFEAARQALTQEPT